jgi:hypothetical protein
MNNRKHYIFLVFLLAVINMLIAANTNAQVDPNQQRSDIAYPMKFVKPLAWSDSPYGIESSESVISIGPFDNYQVSYYNGFAETDIICSPYNYLNFACTDNRVITGNPFLFYTTNGGVTWSNTTVSGFQGDPAFTADSLGNLYFCVLSSGPYVYRSSNGGQSWQALGHVVSNGQADKEWIAADQTNGTYKNNVYVAYVNFATGASCDFWRSTNNGSSWTGPIVMGNGTPNPGPDVCVDANGKVYVGWYDGSGTGVRTSTDGGQTFTSMVQASNHSQPGTIDSYGRYVLKADIRVNGMPHLAVDQTNGPYRGYVYNLYATNPPGPDAADVYMTRSTDGGQTWNSASPVKVNWDDPTYNDNWMADVSVDAQGRVWAMWWDSRNDSANNILCETWAAVSTDGGATFMPNIKVSNQNFNPNIIRIPQPSSSYYLGDYQGISGRSFTMPCWTGQNNTLQDFVAYLPDFGVAFRKTIDTADHGTTENNEVLIPMMGPYSGTVTYTATVTPTPSTGTITFTWSPSNVKTLTGTPDSVGLATVISGDVPYATYTISVTGTESSNIRVHTRSWTLVVNQPNGISHNQNEVPNKFSLDQNFPNPFNPATMIYYSVPKQSNVTIKVYDMLGREVYTVLSSQPTQTGIHMIQFDGSRLASGVYYYRMTAGDFTDVKKMILLK